MKPTVPALLAMLTLAAAPSPAEAHSRHRGPEPKGTVVVTNPTSVPISVSVEGGGSRTLAPRTTEVFAAELGYASLRASFTQYGETIRLLEREVRVHSRGAAYVELEAPKVGRIEVRNATGVRSEVIVNGREVAELAAGTSRVVIVPLGRVEVAMFANGIQVEAACVEMRPFTSTVVVGEAPRFASVAVYNPLPIAVDVRVDGSAERRVAAYGRTVFDHVAVGTATVTSERPGGGRVDTDRAYVSAWSGAQVTVDPPRFGQVTLDSHDDDPVQVFVDGRYVATLAPRAETRLELPVGGALIEVHRLDGRFVERTFVTVDPYREGRVDFGRYEGDHHRRDGDHDGREGHRDDRVSRRDDGERRHEPATW